MYPISYKSKGTALTHLSCKVKGTFKYICISSTLQINHKSVTTATDILSYNTCCFFIYGPLPFRKRALFLKAMIFLKTYGNSMHSSTNKKPNIWCTKWRGRRKWAIWGHHLLTVQVYIDNHLAKKKCSAKPDSRFLL